MIASRRQGITLLELTVGVTVMTGIIASAYFCLHAGFRSQRALDEHMDEVQKARVLLSLITKDLRHACVWNDDFAFVGMDRTLDAMEADNLDFATHYWKPRASGEGDICEISYYVNRDPETGTLGIWRRRDATPDDEPFAGGEREELITGVRALRFEYYDGFWWHDSWGRVDPRRELPTESSSAEDPSLTSLSGNLYGLPDAVRISVAFGEEREQEVRSPVSMDEVSESGRTDAEPSLPMIFQTVVYLNLADRSTRSSSTAEEGSGP